jgi:hypothetical protein
LGIPKTEGVLDVKSLMVEQDQSKQASMRRVRQALGNEDRILLRAASFKVMWIFFASLDLSLSLFLFSFFLLLLTVMSPRAKGNKSLRRVMDGWMDAMEWIRRALL